MRRRRLLAAAGLALIGTGALGATGARVDAQAAPTIIGFGAVAQSDGTGTTFGDPGTPPYPTAAGQQNHTEATLSTGPAGYALASTAWPGPLVGNAGSLATLLGAPPEAGAVNYGGRAEAFAPAGPNEAALPGMSARAEPTATEAIAGSQAVSTGAGADQATTGDSSTISRASFEAGTLTARSTSTTSDIAFAAGAVRIGSVYTEAVTTTDGTTSTAGGITEVSGGEAGGSPFVVDEEGVRFTDPLTGPVGEQVLSQMGMSMFVASPSSTNEGDSASYQAGALVVTWEPPESGQLIVYTFGGSTAEVSIRLGTARIPPSGPTPTTAPATASRPASPPSAGATPAAPAARPSTPTPTTETVTRPPEELPVEPAAAFDRNLSWWSPYLVGAGFVLVGSSRLRREQALLELPVVSSPCPLDRRPSSP